MVFWSYPRETALEVVSHILSTRPSKSGELVWTDSSRVSFFHTSFPVLMYSPCYFWEPRPMFWASRD